MESSRPRGPIVPCQMLPICQMLVATLPRNSFQPHNSRTHGRERHQTGGGGEKTQGTSARTVPHTHLAKTTSPTTPATRARHAQTRAQTPPRQTSAVAKTTSKHAGTPRESTGRGPAPPRSTTTHPPRAHPGHHTTRPSGRAAVATLVRMECGQHGQRPLRRPRRSPHRLRIRTGPGQHPRTRVRDANKADTAEAVARHLAHKQAPPCSAHASSIIAASLSL